MSAFDTRGIVEQIIHRRNQNIHTNCEPPTFSKSINKQIHSRAMKKLHRQNVNTVLITCACTYTFPETVKSLVGIGSVLITL